MSLVTPQQTLAAARDAGLSEEQLSLGEVAVLTFSKAVVDRLEEKCDLEDAAWISQLHHPYAAPRVVKRGEFQGIGVTAVVPPMGASPLACVVEDLVACGVQAVFLVCAAWSLGPPVRFGDLIVPSFSVGPDGTSIHYGNGASDVRASPGVVDALAGACHALGVRFHVGGNGSCEALYRISPLMVSDFQKAGCLCVDNGEASTILAVAQALQFHAGVLFQPYIELAKGWNPACLEGNLYLSTCAIQAEISLRTATLLRVKGVI
jgi:hypothetical protein